jgi:hypothetical protein
MVPSFRSTLLTSLLLPASLACPLVIEGILETATQFYELTYTLIHEHAATNLEEDIAEAFTFFVLFPRPNSDTIAEQKILFFYRYPNLVHLRDQILRRVCQLDQ